MKKLTSKSMSATALGTCILAGSLMSAGGAFAQTEAYTQLSGEWWQWALSIPAGENPLTDTTGADCMLGQRGANWFLAGTFGASEATRTCSIPENATLFFPVINSVGVDTPGACGQGAPIPSQVYRDAAAAFIDGASNLSVLLDGKSIAQLHRVQSKVFWVALPEDNLFTPFCPPNSLPAGVYSPAIDDGIYVRLNPLAAGSHTLNIHAENASAGFIVDVTYHLTVVPVVTK
jgi:hypothetical protein